MAYPTVQTIATGIDETTQQNHSDTLPASDIEPGDILIFAVSSKETRPVFSLSDNSSTSGTWTELKNLGGDYDNTDTYSCLHIWGKVANGDEESTTVSFVTNSGTINSQAWAIFVIRGCPNGLSSVEISTGAVIRGSSGLSTITPDAVTASWGVKDNLFVCLSASADFNQRGTYPATFPSGYTNTGEDHAFDGSTSAASFGIAYATKNSAAASDTPSAFAGYRNSISTPINVDAAAVSIVFEGGGLKAQWDVNTRGRTDDDFYEHVNGTAETSTGSPTKDETYAFDGLTFNGTSQYTQISTLPVGLSATFPDSDFTMAVQCKPSEISPSDYMSIFGAYLSTSNTTRVHILADISSAEALGAIVAQVGGSGEFTNSNDVIDDQDRHVVVYRRETDVVTLWLDGTKEASVNATVSDVGTVDTIGFAGKTDLSITDAQAWYFAGTIYWAAIYDEAISDGAVVALGETSNPFVTAVSASVVEHIAPAYHRRVNPLVRM